MASALSRDSARESAVRTWLTPGFAWLAVINVLLGVFNLLPGAPLDGGWILRGLLWMRNHDRTRAALPADRAGRGLGMLLLWLGLAETEDGEGRCKAEHHQP